MSIVRQVVFLAVATIAAGVVPAQASLAGPRLFPRGARAPGFQDTTYDAVASAYNFTLKSETGAIIVQYRLPLLHPNMVLGVLRVEEIVTGVVPIAAGGLMYRDTLPTSELGQLISPYDLAFTQPYAANHGCALLGHSLNPATGVVSVTFRDSYAAGGTTYFSEKTYALRLVGKSLEIHATSDYMVRNAARYNHAGFQFGDGEGLSQPNLAFHVPYMDSIPVFVARDVFVTRMVDWYSSSASDGLSIAPTVTGNNFRGECAPAVYVNDQREVNAPIDETLYVTVARDVADVFPVIDRPPSEYRRHTADRAVSQSGPSSLYARSTQWVANAQSLGLADMAHIKWDWSKWPLDLNSPDLLPAAPGVPCGVVWGTQAQWQAYANTAAQGNWAFAPYFEESGNDVGYPPAPGQPPYTLILPGSLPGSVQLAANSAYVAAASVRDANNQPKGGWDTALTFQGTNLQGVPGVVHNVELIGPHLREANMTAFAAAIHGAAGYTSFTVAGAHTDAAAGIGDWNNIDQMKSSGFPKTVAENMKWRERSFRALKDGMQGPLFGENSHWRYKAFETYDAGLIDGTSRKIPIYWSPLEGPANAENKDYYVVPDFELSEVASKATGFYGMGFESHFQSASPWGHTSKFVDPWDTTLLSYGHAPFFELALDWEWQDIIRSYYLCYGVSSAMRTSTVTQVRYEDATGLERTLTETLQLLAAGTMDVKAPRLVLRFANGLEFKANHSPTTWTTTVHGQSYTIPTDGFVAAGPGNLLALSAINPSSGQRVDYAINPGHSEMIDRRGYAQSYNGFPGTLLPVPPGLGPVSSDDDKNMVVVRDLRQNSAQYGSGQDHATFMLGTAPALQSLQVAIDDVDKLSVGRPYIGVRAILTDANGNQRDGTGQCTWTSSNPTIVTVNRFGGLTMRTGGTATITALHSTGLQATRTVTATRAPVMSRLEAVALASTKALLTVSTDAACTVTIQLRNVSTGGVTTVAARTDPAQKVHQFALQSLTPMTNYEATPTATNGGGLVTTGGTTGFTTL